ncbi:Exocyst component protein [Handroanthus impetiginosus]|uniref:Exocyst subunit Exo70 family protein n=1 Tax=Handroanthus impetiginosus TaxID=429701 RepID=A0A2G9HPD3_9LAMI|nr:Exocyst component protein [Handroanthus impetiginosus]
MDAEKDNTKTVMDADDNKYPPEKSPKDDKDNNQAEIENNDNNNNNSNNEDCPEKSKEDQELPQKERVNTPSSPKSPSNADPKPEEAESLESEIQEEEKVPDEEVKIQESSSPLPPDLNKVSEEIDQFISSMSSLENDKSTPPDLPIFVEQFVVLVEAKMEDYDSGDSPMKCSRLSEEDSASFLEAVNRVSSLSKALTKFSSEYKYACSINRIGGILQRAMSYLEEEFKSLLEDYKIHESDPKPKQPAPSSSNQEPDQNPQSESSPAEESNISEEILSNLIRLSKAMIAGGYEAECCQVYFVARRNALEESLHKLGFEKHSIDDVHKMSWESLEREIEAWIRTFKQCATAYFSTERKLSDSIFSDHSSISQSIFGGLAHGVTIQLLNFAEAVALTKRAAEKLFKFIDIYEGLRDILLELEKLFPEEWVIGLKTEASMIRSHLGEAMISIFTELENSIKADSAKTQVPGGAVHPLTKYIMNYLEYASEYKETLEQVFREHQKIERADSATGSEFEYNSQTENVHSETVKQSPFQAQITKLMDLLDANVESKSKLYKDPALGSIFMMNNGRYILKKIKGSTEFNSLMGVTWYRKKSSDLRNYHKGYQRETWGKLLGCLHPEGLTANGKVVKPVLKERFKSFNAMFDEIHKTQSNWVVGDEQLQSELRVSISNMVIPAYRSFLGRYSQVFTPGRQTEKYIKYQPEDIETYIDELFDGTATPMGRKKS